MDHGRPKQSRDGYEVKHTDPSPGTARINLTPLLASLKRPLRGSSMSRVIVSTFHTIGTPASGTFRHHSRHCHPWLGGVAERPWVIGQSRARESEAETASSRRTNFPARGKFKPGSAPIPE